MLGNLRKRLSGVLIFSAVSLFAAQAAAAAPLPPASGISPAIAFGSRSPVPLTVFFTAADRSVWTFPPGATRTPTKVSTGYVMGPVAAISNNGTLMVFGEGYGGALWYAARNGNTWTKWTSLGGIVSYPAAAYRGSPGLYSVYVRGADGAVWSRDHSASGWNAWHKLGGLLDPNTGPAAGRVEYGQVYLLAVGLDKELYLAHAGVTAFRPVGGRTTASPALTTAGDTLIAFARGTDNAAWYHRFAPNSSGWHKIGGRLTSGLGAANGTTPDRTGPGPATFTVGLGSDSQIWMVIGNWRTYPPRFTSWFHALGYFNF